MAQVNDYTAILSGNSWAGPGASGSPAFVTFSFAADVQPYLTTDLNPQGFIDSFRPFSTTEQVAARAALKQWADASGLVFLEVAPGEGDICFGSFDFRRDPDYSGFTGFAYYPANEINLESGYSWQSDIGGDVFIDYGDATNAYLLLHEIGHALGFKHPFEGDPTLPPSLDNHDNTLMSYTGNYPRVLGKFDKQAVAAVYGGPAADGANLAGWEFDAASRVLTRDGLRTADTIHGVSVTDIMNGRGGNDVLAGFLGHDTLSGGSGRDAIFGGEGNDTIIGGGGRDDLFGEEGNDRFVFDRRTPGNDTIYWFSNARGDDDALMFDSAIFGHLGRGQDGLGLLRSKFLQVSNFAEARTEDVRFVYDLSTGTLSFDPDGNGARLATAVATFNNFAGITASDIILI